MKGEIRKMGEFNFGERREVNIESEGRRTNNMKDI